MIYLALSILFSSSIMLTFKLIPRQNLSSLPVIFINYLVAIALGLIHVYKHLPKLTFSYFLNLYPAYLAGILFILVFFLFSESARNVGIAITSVSSKMSVIIPVLAGILFWQESVTWSKLLGILFSFLAFILILYKPQNEIKKNAFAFLLPLMLFLGNGINDVISKIAQVHFCQTNIDYVAYLLMVFFIAFAVGLIIIIFLPERRELIIPKTWLWGTILGVLNWYSTYFFLLGLSVFELSIFIPIFNVSIVSLGALLGFLLFKEPLLKLNLIGYLFALLAIGLISL